MRNWKAALAVVAVLAVASQPALADRGRGGAVRGGHAGHPVAPHYSGGHVSPPRYYRSGPRIGVYVGVPVVAAAYYYAPPRYYAPPPAYIAAPAPAWWYYCAPYNDYYPRVQQCPVAWQRVLAQPPAPPAYYPG
jgi:hypothetical protein